MGSVIEADHATGNWIFSKEHIEKKTPSRKDGIDAKKEAWLRKGCCTFIQDAGMRLKVPQLTIATAIMFCHRFFMRQSYAQQDRYVIASTCLFLAGKVEDTPRQLKDVIYITYIIRHKKDKGAEERIKQSREVFEAERELLLAGEYLVMNTLSFDLNINHPYKPLLSTIRKFDKEGPLKHLAQVSWNFVNDGLRTSLGLQFRPHELAAGAIYLAAKFLKITLPQQDGKPWWTEFEVTPSILEDVSSQMLELYEQTKDGSGTTGTSSRRQSKSSAPTRSSAGAKSKGTHPATPSVADRAAQASLTSGASAHPPKQPTPLPPPVLADEPSTVAAGAIPAGKESDGAATVTPIPPAPSVGLESAVETVATKQEAPLKEADLGSTAEHTERVENDHTGLSRGPDTRVEPASGAGTESEQPSEARAALYNGSNPGSKGSVVPEAAARVEAVGSQAAVSLAPVSRLWGTGLAAFEAEQPSVPPVVANAGTGSGGDGGGGVAMDDAMDLDEGLPPPPPLTAPHSTHPQGLPSNGPPQEEGASEKDSAPAAAVAHPEPIVDGKGSVAAPREQQGSDEGQQRNKEDMGEAPGSAVVHPTAKQTAPAAIQGVAGVGVAALQRSSEDGEIGCEEGEIPGSPVSLRGVPSPSRGSRERERERTSRGRSRSRSYSRDRSPSSSQKRRKGGYRSRSRSPSDAPRGRSPSPFRSGDRRQPKQWKERNKALKGNGHRDRDSGDRSRWDRERDRDRDRGRDWDRQGGHRSYSKESGRHRGAPYGDNLDRNRR